MIQIGVVGKPNTGKTTFFVASTLVDAKIASYPFTTIDANRGVGYVRIECVCKDLGVKDTPVNSLCIEGNRFVPVELIDVAGLVPDAWRGRGLGNKFLDELRRASVLVHVVDASGGTDEEGRVIKPGTHDPIEDIIFLEREIDMWIFQILKRDWDRLVKYATISKERASKLISDKLSGLGITMESTERAMEELGLARKKLQEWSDDELLEFIHILRSFSKPMLIAANKSDIPEAEDNIKRMKKELKDYIIIPTSAVSELALRKAAEKGLIKYLPGSEDFIILKEKELTQKQLKGLEYIRENVLKKWGNTGVQQAIDTAVLELLKYIVVFPVEDELRLTDHHGRVLPDALLMPMGSTARDLAYSIHTELGDKFIQAIDVRTKRRLGAEYRLKHRDVIKIVARR
ncbi:MAG: redox-regulated ATPase YchF [Thermoprotei archaeon]|nr:MAG: redox-regulated ATPase YchF [Thermoprotei archaeon]RLE90073.1 MAG: redox-regulated ATPase YchF [Thermoprotei archaeon]